MIHKKVLLDYIENEKNHKENICSNEDRELLEKMFAEINKKSGTKLKYLAEIDMLRIPDSGPIMLRYLDMFRSETIRAYLIPQIVADKVNDRDIIVLRSYLHFKGSDEYISGPGEPSPAHIYSRYDTAISKLKPKKLKQELLALAHDPRDAFYLPLTTRMLAFWKIPEMKDILIYYLDSSNITAKSVSLPEQAENYFPPLFFIKRELRFTAIDGLKYYPSAETIGLVKPHIEDSDCDVRMAAKKALQYIEKHLV